MAEIIGETQVSEEDLARINESLGLGAAAPSDLREMYDELDLRYMVETGKEPPTAAQLAAAFGKFVHGLREGDEGWTQNDTDAYKYAAGTW